MYHLIVLGGGNASCTALMSASENRGAGALLRGKARKAAPCS